MNIWQVDTGGWIVFCADAYECVTAGYRTSSHTKQTKGIEDSIMFKYNILFERFLNA